MFAFFCKKNFCDIWDNLLHTIIINLIMLTLLLALAGLCVLTAYLPGSEGLKNIYMLFLLLISSIILHIFILAEGENAAKIANYESPKLAKFFKNIVPCIKDGALLGATVALLCGITFVSIPYYASQGNMVGLVMMSIVFWMVLISVLALQWFLPIRSLMHNDFKKCLKKCYIIFFDNTLFTIGVGLVNLLNLAITVFTLGILNGTATISITTTNALRLRLYKYDWYEVNPGLTRQQRKDVPWADLIANDKRILGPRKWKSFIFPWKE